MKLTANECLIDGIIELIITEEGEGLFSFIDVSDSKLTDPAEGSELKILDELGDKALPKVMQIQDAYSAQLKSNFQKWRNQLSKLKEKEIKIVENTIEDAEAKIKNLKKDTALSWDSMKKELEQVWDQAQSKIKNILK